MTPHPRQAALAERHETTAYAVMSAKGTPIFKFDSLAKAKAFMTERHARNVRAFIVKETVVRETVS
mgnify:FL=1